MNNEQLQKLSDALNVTGYPHDAITISDTGYHIIKCRQEKIPDNICKILVNAPDFDGLMKWNTGQITFTYKQS